jgi:hypothetical protein
MILLIKDTFTREINEHNLIEQVNEKDYSNLI